MKVERIRYRHWPEAYRCSVGPVELVVITSIGPRILSLCLRGGENLLYEDATDFKVGDWQLWGGHRFTTAPEDEGSYAPDSMGCQLRFDHDRLCIHQRLEDGLSRGLEIMPDRARAGFVLRHTLGNHRAAPWHGAPWAITCVPPGGRVVAPKSNRPARFWEPPGRGYAGAGDPQWQARNDYLAVEPQGRRGKVGVESGPGWLASLRPSCTFVIRGPGRRLEAEYPDGGCNTEIYTCAHYLELETLGPLTTLLPGEKLSHEERWHVLPRAFLPSAWRTIEELTEPEGEKARAAGVPA